jgi:protein gp37
METKIEWCATTGPGGLFYPGYSFNPWWGCMKVSPACKNCYAETLAERFKPGHWGPADITPRLPASAKYWQQPYKWDKKAERLKVRLKVFCASMSDVFEDHPGVTEWRWQLWNLISDTTNLDWLLLTKRPENIIKMLPDYWRLKLPCNIWIGTSVENQHYANERIPELLKVPARIHFLSCEPVTGPINLTRLIRQEYGTAFVDDCLTGFKAHGQGGWFGPKIDWVIAGGESGQQATPSHPAWFRSLRDQCRLNRTPFFFKQWGEYRVHTAGKFPVQDNDDFSLAAKFYDGKGWNDQPVKDQPVEGVDYAFAVRLGKHAAGNILDGKIYNEMPD